MVNVVATNPPMEPPPPSSPLFLDTAHNGEDEGLLSPDDMVLSHISRMLMEDDIDDNLLCQFSDHPALLQAQQTLAQILSSPSFGGGGNSNTTDNGGAEGMKDSLQDSSGSQSTPSSASTKQGADAARALLKRKEASEFFPRDNSVVQDDNGECNILRKLTKKSNRSSIAMVEMEEQPIEMGTQEIFDEMMLRGYETLIRDTEKLRIAMADEVKKNNKKGGANKEERYVVDLNTLLIRCAQAVDTNDYTSARQLLKQIKQNASATGDATQRLAQCFLKGLEARLAGMGSQLWQFLMAQRPSTMEFLKAHKLYMAACCFNKVTLVFSIASIAHVMAGKKKLHIVDYGLHHGFHWASLLRFLANREGGPPETVKITAIGCPQLTPFPVEQIEETGRRLSRCAREFGLPSFEFHAIPAKWEAVCIESLDRDADEVLVVNELFSFNTLMDESICFDDVSPRDAVLKNIREMRPDLFIQGVVNCSYGTSFLTRFREALFYYSAVFDALDATMPRESEQRQVLEQGVLGPCALNVIACEGSDRMNRSNTYRQWQLRNQRAGLRQLPLHPEVVETVRDELKERQYHKDFVVNEDHQWLLQGWKGRILYAHSTWVADDASYP